MGSSFDKNIKIVKSYGKFLRWVVKSHGEFIRKNIRLVRSSGKFLR